MARISGITIESCSPLTDEERTAKSKLLDCDPVVVAQALEYYKRRDETKPLIPERGSSEWREIQQQLVTPFQRRNHFGITPFFRWYDLWIGAYYDRHNRTLYICPVPMLGIAIQFAG